MRLNDEQEEAAGLDGHVVVTACPGSGKTRVLAARVIRGVRELQARRERVIALTFTNRAADEIKARLYQESVPAESLWAGTIHSFALEWILRPYAPYLEVTKRGFSVADEFHRERLLAKIKAEVGLDRREEVSTSYARDGATLNTTEKARRVFLEYKALLREEKLLDYDDILYFAYRMVADRPEIGGNLGAIMRVICVDEVQDVQDLQFGILSAIVRTTTAPMILFFVGDANQSIYESLGALTKTPKEIAAEFGLKRINHVGLSGNYRSSQRIVDFYRRFRPDVGPIISRAEHRYDTGLVTFANQTVDRDGLAAKVGAYIRAALHDGVQPHDICVVAPRWNQVRDLARRLVTELPDVEFDAPGLSPFYSSRDSVWFNLSRLFLTRPSPAQARVRVRWANEVLADLRTSIGSLQVGGAESAKHLLRRVNGISSEETDGMSYLRDVFEQLCGGLGVELERHESLNRSYLMFFEKAENRIAEPAMGVPSDVNSFRKLFSHPSGVVVSTCHQVKGEEYDTVIACGLLKGYVPHWDVVINQPESVAIDQESKLLYVICSRAKRRLHLVSESGHRTRSGYLLETARLLRLVDFEYDGDRA